MEKTLRRIALGLCLLLAGCATLSPLSSPPVPDPSGCRAFLGRLDQAVDRAGVRDASSAPVPGYPVFRANRFVAGLGEKALESSASKDQWLRWMQEIDLASREKEIYALPDAEVAALADGGKADREALIARVSTCSFDLVQEDGAKPGFVEALVPKVRVPEEYSTAMRIAGLYPLAALPAAAGIRDSRVVMLSRFQKEPVVQGSLAAFAPKAASSFSTPDLKRVMGGARKNPLGLPLPDGDQEKALVRTFAPVFLQDVAAPYDRPGRVVWNAGRPEVDTAKPTVYYYLSHGFRKGEAILQINYVLWYPERAGERTPRIEKGRLDGLTVRVSLDGEGAPFMVDVMSNCGCYHFFVPRKGEIEQIRSRSFRFAPLIPQDLPEAFPGKRLEVRVTTGWHQVERLTASEGLSDPVLYDLVPYGSLEALPRSDGRTESLFDGKGIAKGSGRSERYVLFSMGIPSIGSMRQRGHHAIDLLGRAHFDAPGLFDERFLFR